LRTRLLAAASVRPHETEVCPQRSFCALRTAALVIVITAAATPLAVLWGCGGAPSKVKATINQSASLQGDLPEDPLVWRVISSSADTKNVTMSTLFGNDAAVQFARSNAQHNYPSGAAVSLVTWTQQEDDRWFGAKIPQQMKSVEFVFVRTGGDGKPLYSYQTYAGAPLKKVSEQEAPAPAGRTADLLAQRAAVMP
jgi:hypothetical protein